MRSPSFSWPTCGISNWIVGLGEGGASACWQASFRNPAASSWTSSSASNLRRSSASSPQAAARYVARCPAGYCSAPLKMAISRSEFSSTIDACLPHNAKKRNGKGNKSKKGKGRNGEGSRGGGGTGGGKNANTHKLLFFF